MRSQSATTHRDDQVHANCSTGRYVAPFLSKDSKIASARLQSSLDFQLGGRGADKGLGLILAASVDDEQSESELVDMKNKVKQILRRVNRNSEPQASIEGSQYTIHYLIDDALVFLCICDRSYPRKLAFTYLADLRGEFTTTYQSQQYLAATCRPYAFVEFDTFIQRTKKTYQDSRATQNLDKLNDELKDVTKIMTKNIEDLLYRGDSLERMGDMSSRLREDSRKYRKAAVRINWELLIKQYGPVGALAFIMIVFIWWRFF